MNKIAVIGSGIMGRGIAYTASLNGFKVSLHDINPDALIKAEAYITSVFQKSVEKGFIQKEEKQQALNNLSYTTNLKESVTEVELVIEAVLEQIELKVKIFKELDELCSDNTILATNTSTMSPTKIGAATSRPDKVIAMHFFNPVHKMKLIELVKGLDTSSETVKKVQEVGAKLKKQTIEVNEFPGFVTSRMNCLIGNEAMNIVMEGVASAEDVDQAMKLGLNHPMGPLELADLVGLDSRLRNMEYLYKTLGEKYRPSPILLKYVNAGKLGRKSGEGFYNYV